MKKGDLVLATKWSDGSYNDHWAIGYFVKKENDRYFVSDEKSDLFRVNGFNRCQKINEMEAEFILNNHQKLKCTGKSLWWSKNNYKNQELLELLNYG